MVCFKGLDIGEAEGRHCWKEAKMRGGLGTFCNMSSLWVVMDWDDNGRNVGSNVHAVYHGYRVGVGSQLPIFEPPRHTALADISTVFQIFSPLASKRL